MICLNYDLLEKLIGIQVDAWTSFTAATDAEDDDFECVYWKKDEQIEKERKLKKAWRDLDRDFISEDKFIDLMSEFPEENEERESK